MDLRNIFKVGDIVQFDAVIGPDDARCKWRYVTKIVIFQFYPIHDRHFSANKKSSLHERVALRRHFAPLLFFQTTDKKFDPENSRGF